MIFRPGDRTNEQFPCDILKRIPGGGMSEVYLAKLHNTQHFMVVKGVSQNAPESCKKALEREAGILKEVRLETIPEIYGYFEEKEKRYFIMSYHKGISLEEAVLKGHLSEKQIKQMGLSLCGTFAYLHKKEIIYGDLKPSNVIWAKNSAVLLDFGTAMFLGEADQHRFFRGTAGYAAPECFAESNNAGTRLVDIFALGATLYRLLEGREPGRHFGRFFLQETQKKNRWQSVLDKCCAPEPEERYRSMAEVYHAINKIKI